MNKKAEIAAVDALLKARFPTGRIVEWDRERPDVVVEIDGETVGIELTTLTEAVPRQGIAPQKWVAECNRVVQLAQEAFAQRDARQLIVRFEMVPAWIPPDRAGMRTLADELATIAWDVLNAPPPWLEPDEAITLHDPHPSVSWVYVSATKYTAYWAPSFVQSVSRASADDVWETVARKEPELDVYRSAAPKVWLAINCDLSGQGISLNPPAPDFLVFTGFDRVFCYGFGRGEWVEIPTRPRPADGAG